MITVQVKGMKEIQAALKRLPAELRDKALVAGINKTAAKARTEMTRAITSEYNISAAAVRNSLDIVRASARRAQIVAVLRAFGSRKRKGRSLNLIHFLEQKISLAELRRRRSAGTGQALRFKIKKTGGQKTIAGAFLGNKGRTVFQRVGASRLPIQPVQVIDVPQMFNTRRISNRVMLRINSELAIEVDRGIKMVLAKQGLGK